MIRTLGAAVALVAVALGAAAAARATPEPLAQVDVSRAAGVQAEVAVAIDPGNDQVLLAGSNSLADLNPKTTPGFSRVYTSADGGGTWTSAPGPPAVQGTGKRRCSFGDPAVAFGRGGRQYYAFLTGPCDAGSVPQKAPPRISLEVAARDGSAAPWRTAAVFPVRSARFDDKPSLAVDVSPTSPHVDRVYAAWSKSVLTGRGTVRTVIAVSHSDDGGAFWSKPATASDGTTDRPPIFATLALDRAGTVYLGWTDDRRRLWIDRSTDGGDTFGGDVTVDTAFGLPGPPCVTEGISVPAQARRCITPVPTVVLDDRPGVPERIYMTYSAPGGDGHEQDVFVAAFDSTLAPLLGAPAGGRVQVTPPDGALAADQFMPAAAVDPSSGHVWVCYYDTSGDRRRLRSVYTCTSSADGGVTWATPVHAASAASNETVAAASSFQYGDYEGVAVVNGVAHPIWSDSRDLAARHEEIYTTVLTDAQLQPAQQP